MARLLEAYRDTAFHFWPAHYVYGVVDSQEAAEKALTDLLASGVSPDHLRTWYGTADDEPIDPKGERHGRIARMWRTLEQITGERELLERYAAELDNGHVCIGVRCATDDAKTAASGILQRYGGHFVSYFSVYSWEQLAP